MKLKIVKMLAHPRSSLNAGEAARAIRLARLAKRDPDQFETVCTSADSILLHNAALAASSWPHNLYHFFSELSARVANLKA